MIKTVWNVKVKYSWRDIYFTFDTAEDAEAFARTAIEHYQPDEEKFSVTVSAVLATDITAKPEEPAE